MITTELFHIENERRHVVRSQLVDRSTMATPSSPGTIFSADVTCLTCSHEWHAAPRHGLTALLAGTHFQCPACGADEVVSNRR